MRLGLQADQEGAGISTHNPTAVSMVAHTGPDGDDDAEDQGMAPMVKRSTDVTPSESGGEEVEGGSSDDGSCWASWERSGSPGKRTRCSKVNALVPTTTVAKAPYGPAQRCSCVLQHRGFGSVEKNNNKS